jgi:chloramphenicol-sensitive protein RarD
VAAGLVTLLPLLWFNAAAKRLKLSTVGILQYVAPTGQFLLAVLLFGETFTPVHMVTFGCIWAGLALYTADALRGNKGRGQ